MADAEKRYYWLKLKRDFFKRHDIRIIEAMPNGKDYILFYLKLLCESVDHDGNLRFSEQIPYNEDMLATITNTNVDVVRSAIKVFSELQMMEILDDGTVYMREVQKMIGSETYWAERKRIQKARKQGAEFENITRLSGEQFALPSGEVHFVDEKRYGGNGMKVWDRANGKCEICGSTENLCIHHNNGYSNSLEDLVLVCRSCHRKIEAGEIDWKFSNDFPKCPSKSKSKSIDIDKDIYIGSSEPTKPKSSKFIPPTYEEVKAYCDERHNHVDPHKFIDFYESKGWMVGKTKMKDWKASVRTWENSNKKASASTDYIQRDYFSSEYEDRQRKAVAGLEQALMDDFPNLD